MAALPRTYIHVWLPIQFLLLVVASDSVLENVTSTITPIITTVTTVKTVDSVRTAGSIISRVVKPGSIYQTAEFQTPYSNGTLTHLTVSEKIQDVFVGAVNYIYSLDKDLNKRQEVKTGPELDSGKCPPPVDELKTCTYPRQYINNVNKILVIDEVDDLLIACGTLYHGYCEKRHIANISHMEPRDVRSSVVTNNASASIVAFIAPGPSPLNDGDQQRVLYVSVSWSKPEGILEDVPAFSSRKLTDFTLAAKDSLKFTSTSFNFEGQQRPQFPVRYIYGFSSGDFSYMLTVQKRDLRPESVAYHSVIVRVCQTDVNYYSYVEVPLMCSFDSNNENNTYNILVAAHLAKPGRALALSLNIDIKTDVLFTVFARVQNHSSEHKAEALCIFSMDFVRSNFTKTIRDCFNGIGHSAGGHLGISKECTKNTFKITDNYCGDTDSNQPIAGTTAIRSRPILTFPQPASNLTSIRVTTTHEYTVAFVGTKDGKVMKISLEPNNSASIYETISVVPNRSIEADMSFDDDSEHLYILTDKKVVKLKVQNCTQYTTCSDCLGARDPYCGWCSLENKCSQRDDCQGSDQSKRWLPYDSQECPKIKKISPDDQLQRDKVNLLTLDIQHIPDFQGPAAYKCVFTSISNPDSPSLTTLANRTSNSLQCYTPPGDQLPQFDANHDSVPMKLSVLMSELELVHETVTFFDCGIHKSCTNCILSQFSCSWCTRKHMCTDDSNEHCNMDVLITGPSTNSSTMNCPKIETVETQTRREILVPSGSRKSIVVKGTSLQTFQLDNLRCQFNDEEIPATLTPINESDYLITCKEKTFNYLPDVASQDAHLKIVWGGGDSVLDNPKGILGDAISTPGTSPLVTTPHPSSSSVRTESTEVVPPTPSFFRHDFECHQTFMRVYIQNSLVPNAELTMKDPGCRLQDNGTHYVISFLYDMCGTSLTSYTDHVNVQNQITVHTILSNVSGVEFVPDYIIPLQCSVNRTRSIHSAFQVVTRDPMDEHDRMASDFDIKEYRSELYQDEITEYPVLIPFNREIFFDLVLSNNQTNSGISVTKCEATPSSNPNDATRLTLITNGCSASPAVKVQGRYRIDHFRFSVQAFHFSGSINQNNTVYVHCNVSICQPGTCTTVCSRNIRRRRSSRHDVTLTSGTHIVASEVN